MLENQDIHGAILAIVESMRLQGISPGRLKNFENAYNVFEQYLRDNNTTEIDESLCLEYVYAKTGQRFECVTSNGRVDSVTAQYVDVRLDRKREVLDAYHNAVHPDKEKKTEIAKTTQKKMGSSFDYIQSYLNKLFK